MILHKSPRPGAVILESAAVYGLTAVVLFALLIGGIGVFHYQEVAYLAQEGARWACVKGTDYQSEVAGAKAATAKDVYDNAIKPKIFTLDEDRLSYNVHWNSKNSPVTPSSDYTKGVRHTVTVTVTYEWLPEWFFIGPMTMTSSTTVQMSY